MYDAKGEKTWEAQLDIYGRVRTFVGRSLSDCPFRYQGQYEDEETGLYYNRFRYYDPSTGSYISQDPIRLAGGNPTLYGYVKNVNSWVDCFGLDPYGPNQSVYALYNKTDVANGIPIEGANPYYVGISQDSDVRLGQHTGKGRFDPKTDVKVDLHKNIDYATARAYEQKYIEDFKTIDTNNTKANQQNSFRHNRQDSRGQAFESEYNRINKSH
jgi:RHS repeat-associated protein